MLNIECCLNRRNGDGGGAVQLFCTACENSPNKNGIAMFKHERLCSSSVRDIILFSAFISPLPAMSRLCAHKYKLKIESYILNLLLYIDVGWMSYRVVVKHDTCDTRCI